MNITPLILSSLFLIGCTSSNLSPIPKIEKNIPKKTSKVEDKILKKIKSISTRSKTKKYDIGRKESNGELFTGDIRFDSTDKYISIENSKWVFPWSLKVMNGDKVVWKGELSGNSNEPDSFIIPTDILKKGYKIEVISFKKLVMNSEIK